MNATTAMTAHPVVFWTESLTRTAQRCPGDDVCSAESKKLTFDCQ